MTNRLLKFLVVILIASSPALAQPARTGSDFELEALEKKLETARESLELIAIHLNFGDIYTSRSQRSDAVASYSLARSTAALLRKRSRAQSDLTLYATATAYEGLSLAKLGRSHESFDRFEESLRYLGDSAKIWNLYSSAMLLDGRPEKASSLATAAVRIAEVEATSNPAPRTHLDLEIYRYALASAQASTSNKVAALDTLREVASNLDRPIFESIRNTVDREEKFEIYSSVRGDADAFVSLFNRVHLRIGKLREERNESLLAREAYERVLTLRSDDPSALAALARLGTTDRANSFARAFEANPFSFELISSYRQYLSDGGSAASPSATRGGDVRRVVEQLEQNKHRDAEAGSAKLLVEAPQNDGAKYLRLLVLVERGAADEARGVLEDLPAGSREAREIRRRLDETSDTSLAFLDFAVTPHRASASELIAVLRALRDETVTAGQSRKLDALSFTNSLELSEVEPGAIETSVTSGEIENVPFSFGRAVRFQGRFVGSSTLEYQIVGATVVDGRDALLLEPKGLGR